MVVLNWDFVLSLHPTRISKGAPPPGYFRRLGKQRAQDDLILRKRDRMRRWLCCTCQVEESYPSNDNGLVKSHSGGHADGVHNNKVQPPLKFDPQKAVPTIEVPALSLDELKEKTENFGSKALIGEGSYGRVYFANLNNGKSVAVKKLDVSTEAESNNEFLTQVAMVSTLKHDNLVELCGYCVEGNACLLPYEFATMGSLQDILHGRKGVQGAQPGPVLDWMQRVNIVVDAAKGLDYLHQKIPASFSLQLGKGDLDLPLKRHRKLLNTEKLIFKNDEKSGTYVVLTVEPEGVVAIPNAKEREMVVYNIVCDELVVGIPHKSWWVVILAVVCLVVAFVIPTFLPSVLVASSANRTRGSPSKNY